jgi:hypothetical protein
LKVRRVLRPVIQAFEFDYKLSKHGPGAVSTPRVKTQVEKFLNMGLDRRVDYLLFKEFGLRQEAFTPFDLSEEDRTSRAIFVPKTWKKLRGISAEPSGLQFFQQAVFGSITRSVNSTYLRHVIKLHDQGVSGSKALRGSCDGSLATIDLSSASDSVTLRIVKDIFGNTRLCRWLLATRSTHTLIDNERLELRKFAPMGSACCFPVECLVFAGIVLATASSVLRKPLRLSDYQVYGDDIICPSEIALQVMDNLVLMGFTVNPSKSFSSGDFRESCGVEAWKGFDITPLRLKDLSFDFDGSNPLSYEDQSRIVSYMNSLYNRGFKETRSFLLGKLLVSPILLKGEKFHAKHSLIFGSGGFGTLCTVNATNFHVRQVPITGMKAFGRFDYQRYGYECIHWKPRHKKMSADLRTKSDEANYLMWLLTTSTDSASPATYDLTYWKNLDDSPSDPNRQTLRMVPTFGIVDPWYNY